MSICGICGKDFDATASGSNIFCPDCKHYDRGECYHPRHERHLQSICQADDDFCSYGERKEKM